jgi:excisionase family DNA binding protein
MAHLPSLDRAAKRHRPGGNQDSRRTIQLSFSHVDLPGRPLFTKKSLCVYLVISQSTLDRLVSAGKLASRRIGGEVRFRPDDVENFITATKE